MFGGIIELKINFFEKKKKTGAVIDFVSIPEPETETSVKWVGKRKKEKL